MKILISNDDGIYSPGIIALANVASGFGDVLIVAPDVEQSSMSHAITSTRPIRFKKVALGDFEAYRVNGTPADCVALGTHNWGRIDLVLSGINLGSVMLSGIPARLRQRNKRLCSACAVSLSAPRRATKRRNQISLSWNPTY